MATSSPPMNIAHKRASSALSPPLVSRSISSQIGSLTDTFDFGSQSPLTSALHFDFGTSPKMSTHTPHYANTYYSAFAPATLSSSPAEYCDFERDYCSNFSCCDMTLPDMHALVAHFEDAHVAVGDNMSTGLGLALSMPFPTPSSNLTRISSSTAHSASSQAHVPRLMIDSQLGNDNVHGDLDFSAAPSPLSSAGPETPPASASDANGFAYGFPNNITNSVIATMNGLYTSYTASPVSPSSSFSSCGSNSTRGSPTPVLSQTARMQAKEDDDILMNFDPLDVDMNHMNVETLSPVMMSLTPVSARLRSELAFGVPGVSVGVDSTPPSPLARNTRHASVLRAAAVAAGASTSVGLPPSLFTSPASSAPGSSSTSRAGSPGAAHSSGKSERSSGGGPVRRERSKKSSGSGGSTSSLGSATLAAAGTAGGSGHGVKRHSAAAALIQEENGGMETASESESASSSEKNAGGGRRQQREKAYKCPKPGCTKSYLNPNGLKYHASKGTCTFATSCSPTTSASTGTGTTPTSPMSPSSVSPISSTEHSMSLATSSPQAASNTALLAMGSVTSQACMSSPLVAVAPRAVSATATTTPVMVYAQAYMHPHPHHNALAHLHANTQQGRIGYGGMATTGASSGNLGAAAATTNATVAMATTASVNASAIVGELAF